MTAKSAIRQLLTENRLDEAIDEFNRRYIPSTRLVSHQQREEAKKCLAELFAEEPIVPQVPLSPPAAPAGSPSSAQKSNESENPSLVKKLQEKIRKLEERKEEIRAFGMKCFNESEAMQKRLALLEEERDRLVNDNKKLEVACDKALQHARYYQSNSQILENTCKTLQHEFEQVKAKVQAGALSYGSQLSSSSDQIDNDSQISPDIIADSMDDSESDSNQYDHFVPQVQPVNTKARYPNIDPDLVPQSFNRPRTNGPIREQSRFPEQRMASKPTKQPKQKSSTTNAVTRERSSTTINDLVLARYLFENEQVRAFSGKSGSFYGTIVQSEKQQYGITDELSSDATVYTNPSSWVKRDIVLQHVQKNVSIARKSQYSGWENVKVQRTCPKTNSPKWTKLAVIRKMYDSAREASVQPQNYTFTQVGQYAYGSSY
uniref:Uncharacterized protein n=1 Tax=Clandestinovirus TaxID=2831644 RepID=A0A8F8KL37_9VIRU|nr:hypothetical protein KOM_12_405 [Clandestinovirus]